MRIALLSTFACLLACALTAPHAPPPLVGLRLEGAARDAVRERLGPPVNVTAGVGVVLFDYELEDGTGRRPVIVADGVVVRVPGHLRHGTATGFEALLGAPIEVAVTQLGSAESVQLGTGASVLLFPQAEVQVSQGLVVGIRPR